MRNVRLIYQKTDRAKYISHLDLNRLMLRVIKRSKLPVWYTEGFNPHVFITFALPLSLGFESRYDVMDFRVEDDSLSNEDILAALKSALPESIVAVKVIDPKLKAKELCFAQFKIIVHCDEQNRTKLENLLNAGEILVEKTTKKKEIKSFDVKPKIKDMHIQTTDYGMDVTLLLPAGCDENINPMLIFDKATADGIEFDIENVIRGDLYDKNMEIFC
ncbi:MAG: DUF2344 domain-containing protein [Clostridia bacterium]|nr:DUF2344 domain-containing protein [Clostridia bacterium]